MSLPNDYPCVFSVVIKKENIEINIFVKYVAENIISKLRSNSRVTPEKFRDYLELKIPGKKECQTFNIIEV
jgi:hypothetical protein